MKSIANDLNEIDQNDKDAQESVSKETVTFDGSLENDLLPNESNDNQEIDELVEVFTRKSNENSN